jgi:hypothetical protein
MEWVEVGGVQPLRIPSSVVALRHDNDRCYLLPADVLRFAPGLGDAEVVPRGTDGSYILATLTTVAVDQLVMYLRTRDPAYRESNHCRHAIQLLRVDTAALETPVVDDIVTATLRGVDVEKVRNFGYNTGSVEVVPYGWLGRTALDPSLLRLSATPGAPVHEVVREAMGLAYLPERVVVVEVKRHTIVNVFGDACAEAPGATFRAMGSLNGSTVVAYEVPPDTGFTVEVIHFRPGGDRFGYPRICCLPTGATNAMVHDALAKDAHAFLTHATDGDKAAGLGPGDIFSRVQAGMDDLARDDAPFVRTGAAPVHGALKVWFHDEPYALLCETVGAWYADSKFTGKAHVEVFMGRVTSADADTVAVRGGRGDGGDGVTWVRREDVVVGVPRQGLLHRTG